MAEFHQPANIQRGFVNIYVDKEGRVSLAMASTQFHADEAAHLAIKNGRWTQIATVGVGYVLTAKEQS